MDTIELRGLCAKGYHGVFEHERMDGQIFVVDLMLSVDTHLAALSDDVRDTVNYADVAHGVAEIIRGKPVNLIETLAQNIATFVLSFGAVQQVVVTVHKPDAPVSEHIADIAVTIRRESDA